MNDSERFAKACSHFDAREYFEAHEEWEELWLEASGSRHAFLQALIQIATALHHTRNENFNGGRKLLARSLGYLDRAGTESREIDLALLREAVLDFELAFQARDRGEAFMPPYFLLPRR